MSKKQRYTKKQEDFHTVPGLKVTVGDGEKDFEKALRRFNKKVQQDGLLKEIREREYHEKPSVTRKRKIAIGKKREQKRNEELFGSTKGRQS